MEISLGRWVGAGLLGASILAWSGLAVAQSDAAIPEVAMREPWVQQLAVLQSLSVPITNAETPVRPVVKQAETMHAKTFYHAQRTR